MAEDQQDDDSSKTEEPTQHKLQEARKRGQVVTSQEVKHFVMLSAMAGVILAAAPSLAERTTNMLAAFITNVSLVDVDFDTMLVHTREMAIEMAIMFALPIIVLVFAAIFSSVIQHGFVLSAAQLEPKLSKISLIAGFKRLFSARSFIEFVKGIAKIAIVGAVAAFAALPAFMQMEAYPALAKTAIMPLFWETVLKMLGAMLFMIAFIAIGDYLFQYFDFMRKQRMTIREVKDEIKQTEGDPMIRARLRQIRTERARRRMMSAVPESDVVITNPTHFAVALAYDSSEAGAPRVTAKGADLIAQKIREVAREHDVPIVENPPLARTLYDEVEVDEEIPEAHYRAVAEIISYVFQARGHQPH
ncbi:MAG: flagellar biosynthesis protein FlhB [Pseudomonadota bacterium]